MKIAVVGGGIFGVTCAWYLAKHGFLVDLFEKAGDLLQAASGINQYRLHRGYHYPRSFATASQSLREFPRFLEHYGSAVFEAEHYYGVAKEGSLSSPEQCRRAWESCGLDFEEAELSLLNPKTVGWCARVREALLDPAALRQLGRRYLERWRVGMRLGREIGFRDLKGYDLIVVAGYVANNAWLESADLPEKEYQFELCEKPVLALPGRFRNKSVVILDGPFLCIDPVANTDTFVMGNVVHAIHHRNIGLHPELSPAYAPLLNRGVIAGPPITRIDDFLASAAVYFPGIGGAKHLGSMFTVRAVQPHREHDDARPTIVEELSDRVVTVFSGKIGTCVAAAEEVLQIAARKRGIEPWSESALSG
ncbi:MAG TPA: FAD-dependent oxidoreductase [bacterium]|nr:FAD-dependent oxidoreductase [bacterium]